MGHKRLPLPPQRMTGTTECAMDFESLQEAEGAF
jgi:hypothetical protein